MRWLHSQLKQENGHAIMKGEPVLEMQDEKRPNYAAKEDVEPSPVTKDHCTPVQLGNGESCRLAHIRTRIGRTFLYT